MRGVFLDRDGVINVYRENYIRCLADFEYYDCCQQAFELLGEMALPIVVVTNQSGIARGFQPESEVLALNKKLIEDAQAWGATIASVQYCPHLPSAACRCRKPEPGMFEAGSKVAAVELAGSYMVGDSPADTAAGKALGMTTLRVATGRGTEGTKINDDFFVADFLAAIRQIHSLERS